MFIISSLILCTVASYIFYGKIQSVLQVKIDIKRRIKY